MTAILDSSTLFTESQGLLHLNGIQALARLPLDQIRADARRGLRNGLFISGYRGSPLGGLDQQLWSQQDLLRAHSIFFCDGLNEDLAATAVWGTQMLHTVGQRDYDGVLGLWYGKAPGVDRSGDVLKHGNYTGIARNGGVLVITGDDPSCKSSSLPSQSECLLYHVGIPSLYPSDPQEILDYGQHGYLMSRCAGLWVGLKIVTNIADGSGYAEVAPDRINAVVPEFEFEGKPFAPTMNLGMNVRAEALDMERTLYGARQEMARRYARANGLNRIVIDTPQAWLGIVCAGKTYRDVRQALQELGLDEAALRRYGVRLLKIGMLFPLEPQVVREFARGLEEILVVEEKRAFLELFIKDILYGLTQPPRVLGKYDEQQRPLLPLHGEFEAEVIAPALAQRLTRKLRIDSVESWSRRSKQPSSLSTPSPGRVPWYCPGCPHNISTRAPQGSVVSAGIGCHTMAMWMKRNVVMGTHMGAEGAQWIGMAPFTQTGHLVQNMGDGTYFHSGRLAIAYAAATGANMTFKLLFNGHVSMTGGQMAMGSRPLEAVVQELLALGVKRIIVTTDQPANYRHRQLAGATEVWHRDRLSEAQRILAEIKGTTVLLHEQECAAELRRRRAVDPSLKKSRRLFINERVCEGCGDCGAESNCIAVEPVASEYGRKTRIRQSACNQDYSCAKGFCPAFVSVTARDGGKRHQLPEMTRALPEPVRKVPYDEFECHIMGIGGTGTVTVAQILATAVNIEGRFSSGLDQTGLAQKGGAVVSDIKISARPFGGANKISDNCADLYLGLDILTAATAVNLAKSHPQRSIAVISTSILPTGFMAVNRSEPVPVLEDLIAVIDRVSRRSDNCYLDTLQLADALFRDSMAANMLLLGAAYQSGALPLTADAIEAAIRQVNIQPALQALAFRWGRLAVADPAAVWSQLPALAPAPQPTPAMQALIDATRARGECRDLLEIRIPDLVAYQNMAYAKKYGAAVGRAVAAEQAAMPGRTDFATAVARNLYKLMAYKDEYEVARLHADPLFAAQLEREFGKGYRLQYHLAPPLLAQRDPATGQLRKGTYSGWLLVGFKLLARLKFLRGSAFDPFGRSAERRQERQLIDDYLRTIEQLSVALDPSNYDTAVQIAAIPEQIRGYGHIKQRAVIAAAKRQSELLADFQLRCDNIVAVTI